MLAGQNHHPSILLCHDCLPCMHGTARHGADGSAAAGGATDFAVDYEHRACDKLKRADVIELLAQAVPQPPYKVNLRAPHRTILVNAIRNTAALSVVADYKQLARYNLRRLTEEEGEQQEGQQQHQGQQQQQEQAAGDPPADAAATAAGAQAAGGQQAQPAAAAADDGGGDGDAAATAAATTDGAAPAGVAADDAS